MLLGNYASKSGTDKHIWLKGFNVAWKNEDLSCWREDIKIEKCCCKIPRSKKKLSGKVVGNRGPFQLLNISI